VSDRVVTGAVLRAEREALKRLRRRNVFTISKTGSGAGAAGAVAPEGVPGTGTAEGARRRRDVQTEIGHRRQHRREALGRLRSGGRRGRGRGRRRGTRRDLHGLFSPSERPRGAPELPGWKAGRSRRRRFDDERSGGEAGLGGGSDILNVASPDREGALGGAGGMKGIVFSVRVAGGGAFGAPAGFLMASRMSRAMSAPF